MNIKTNKNHIRNAVEKFFDVKVLNVRTSVLPGKTKRAGKGFKKTAKSKKLMFNSKTARRLNSSRHLR